MVDIVVVGRGTGNCPLVGQLSHAHQESGVDGVHIDGVAHCAADAGIGPRAVEGTVGDQAQALDAHAVLVVFLDVDAGAVQLLQDGRVTKADPVHIILVGLEGGVCGAGLGDEGDLDGIQIGQTFLPVILVLGIDGVSVVLKLAQLEGASAAGRSVQTAGIIDGLGAHVVDKEANGLQRGGVRLSHHHLDVVVIDDLAGSDVGDLGAVVSLILFDVALDGLSIERLAVGEVDALAQGPSDAQLVRIHGPIGCQIGDQVALGVVADQALIGQGQVVDGGVAGSAGRVARGGNGAGIAQTERAAGLRFTGRCCGCGGSRAARRAGCGGAGRAAACGQRQSRCGNAHSLEEVPTRDAFHSEFSFLFLRSCVLHGPLSAVLLLYLV